MDMLTPHMLVRTSPRAVLLRALSGGEGAPLAGQSDRF